MRNAYILDTLPSVEIQEIVKLGGEIVKKCEGVIHKENVETSPFRKFIESWFKLRLKYKNEGNHIKQKFVKLLMNSWFLENNCTGITEEF